jgi:hypothetical protein
MTLQGQIITDDSRKKEIFESSGTIAIVGLSLHPDQPSNIVAKYLQQQGYKIIPIRPGADKILGEKAYASLDDVREAVDVVDVFRNSEQILPHAREALRLKPKVFWMQLNIENQEAADLLTASGIDVIMNQCIKIEHDRLCR